MFFFVFDIVAKVFILLFRCFRCFDISTVDGIVVVIVVIVVVDVVVENFQTFWNCPLLGLALSDSKLPIFFAFDHFRGLVSLYLLYII
jgi:hypothetical protein